MGKHWKIKFPLGVIDLVLFAVALILFAVGALLLWLSPIWWGYYLVALDVRFWPPWKLIGIVIIIVESLLVIRYWPSKKRRKSEQTQDMER